MKLFRITLALVALMTSTTIFSQNIINSNIIQVTITGTTSRADLANMANEMKTQGINFRYSPNFDSNAKLIGIKYVILDQAGVELGKAENMKLNVEGSKTQFRLRKEQNGFQMICTGSCPD
jgi:hypothetical protein